MKRGNKREEIAEAARLLFYRHGIRRVTVEEICVAAGASKMTFYKYFPNKIELARHVVDKLFASILARFSALMESDLPFPEKMHGLLQMKIESARGANGAFIMELYKDAGGALAGHVRERMQEAFRLTVDYFTAARRDGFIRKEVQPALMLALLDKMLELFLDERLHAAYSDARELSVEITRCFLHGILTGR
jgi:AcrR family transcriptional regulator